MINRFLSLILNSTTEFNRMIIKVIRVTRRGQIPFEINIRKIVNGNN